MNVPFRNLRTTDHLLLVEMLSDSPWAIELKMVIICSLFSIRVLSLSFSK